MKLHEQGVTFLTVAEVGVLSRNSAIVDGWNVTEQKDERYDP